MLKCGYKQNERIILKKSIYILPGVAYWHPCRFHQKFWIIICRNIYCTECLSLQCLFIHFFSDITSVKSCIILFDIVSPSQFNSISEVFVWIILSTGTMFFPLSCPIKSYSRKYWYGCIIDKMKTLTDVHNSVTNGWIRIKCVENFITFI